MKNLLKTAFGPMGQVLYVWGGGWAYQDADWSDYVRTIGIPASWRRFYDDARPDYQWKNFRGKDCNPYNYCGLDCSGYMSWVMYNVFSTESVTDPAIGYEATVFARRLSEDRGLGRWIHISGNKCTDRIWYENIVKKMHPGSIVSISGHVYLVVGVCDDNSVLIIHSSPTNSVSGESGGGVLLSAISTISDDETSCKAFKLAEEYMKKYLPDWCSRYPTAMKKASTYLGFSEDNENTGIFTWDVCESGITDSDGIMNMNAKQVLETLIAG